MVPDESDMLSTNKEKVLAMSLKQLKMQFFFPLGVKDFSIYCNSF